MLENHFLYRFSERGKDPIVKAMTPETVAALGGKNSGWKILSQEETEKYLADHADAKAIAANQNRSATPSSQVQTVNYIAPMKPADQLAPKEIADGEAEKALAEAERKQEAINRQDGVKATRPPANDPAHDPSLDSGIQFVDETTKTGEDAFNEGTENQAETQNEATTPIAESITSNPNAPDQQAQAGGKKVVKTETIEQAKAGK